MEEIAEIPAKLAPARSPEEALSLRLWVVLSRARASVGRVAEADIDRHGLSNYVCDPVMYAKSLSNS